MAEISSYPLKIPKPGDLITFSETYDANTANPVVGNPTKSATIGSINALAINGTVNKIALFTTASSVGDSIITQNAGRIGINTIANNEILNIEGKIALNNNTNSVSIGKNTGGTGNQCVAIGSEALAAGTIPSNVAVGFRSLQNLTTGGLNTSIGTESLQNNITGAGNVSIGYRAMQTANGTNNVGVGKSCLVGIQGNNNTAVGTQSGVNDNSYTNSTAIGFNAKAEASNTAKIGNNSVTALYVGGNGAGVVLKSPNGTAYKITVDNAGAIIATAI